MAGVVRSAVGRAVVERAGGTPVARCRTSTPTRWRRPLRARTPSRTSRRSAPSAPRHLRGGERRGHAARGRRGGARRRPAHRVLQRPRGRALRHGAAHDQPLLPLQAERGGGALPVGPRGRRSSARRTSSGPATASSAPCCARWRRASSSGRATAATGCSRWRCRTRRPRSSPRRAARRRRPSASRVRPRRPRADRVRRVRRAAGGARPRARPSGRVLDPGRPGGGGGSAGAERRLPRHAAGRAGLHVVRRGVGSRSARPRLLRRPLVALDAALDAALRSTGG